MTVITEIFMSIGLGDEDQQGRTKIVIQAGNPTSVQANLHTFTG